MPLTFGQFSAWIEVDGSEIPIFDAQQNNKEVTGESWSLFLGPKILLSIKTRVDPIGDRYIVCLHRLEHTLIIETIHVYGNREGALLRRMFHLIRPDNTGIRISVSSGLPDIGHLQCAVTFTWTDNLEGSEAEWCMRGLRKHTRLLAFLLPVLPRNPSCSRHSSWQVLSCLSYLPYLLTIIADDDEYLQQGTTAGLGDVKLVISYATLGPSVNSNESYNPIGKIHERSKKATGHKIGYGVPVF